MLGRITDIASSRRGKWLVLALWLLAAGLIVPLAPMLSQVTNNDESAFLPRDAESTRVQQLVKEHFPSNGTPAIIVVHDPAGLSEADLASARQLSDWLASGQAGDNVQSVLSAFTLPQSADQFTSADKTTMTVVVNITGAPAGDAYTGTIERIRGRADRLSGGSLQIQVTGPGGILADLLKVFQGIDGFLLLVTGGLVLVLLVLIYRSPVVALVPLVSVGWVYSLAGGIGALLAEHAGLPVNGQASGIMTVLLFGAGTDYCLFVSSRYREELALVEDKHEAMRRTMRGVGEAILSAAATILLATLFLLLATLRSNQALGPLLAIAIAVMLLAALTLVPAILTILGRRSYWPFSPRFTPGVRREREHHGIWTRVAGIVSHRPGVVLAGTVGVFLLLSLGVAGIRTDYDSLSSLPSGSESRRGFELLRQGFPAGDLAPTEAYLTLPAGSDVYAPSTLRAIDQVTQALARQPSVSSISSPSRPFGTQAPVGPEQVLAAAGAGSSSAPDPALAASRALVAPDGTVVELRIVLKENPYSLAALNQIPGLREAARSAVRDAGLGNGSILVGGPTATTYDTKVANSRDERVVLPLILLAIAVVLALLLRSLIAPLYLLATTVLSYFTALGLSTLVFEHLLGQSGLGGSVPFYLFVFLVALGIDYNIYLMARVREEAGRHGLRQGTVLALGRTGGVITSAGIILAGTFAALMTLPLRDLFQLGFAVAAGVLLDTFIVRSLMVPSIVLLLGRWNWWPSRASTASPAEAGLSEPDRPYATGS